MKECFALSNHFGMTGKVCDVVDMSKMSAKEFNEVCGTTRCPFYKPKDCEDWIRIEGKNGVYIYPPEEYFNGGLDKSKGVKI